MIDTSLQGTDNDKDPRNVPDLEVGVSAKRYSAESDVTYENYPDIIDEIKANASASAGEHAQ